MIFLLSREINETFTIMNFHMSPAWLIMLNCHLVVIFLTCLYKFQKQSDKTVEQRSDQSLLDQHLELKKKAEGNNSEKFITSYYLYLIYLKQRKPFRTSELTLLGVCVHPELNNYQTLTKGGNTVSGGFNRIVDDRSICLSGTHFLGFFFFLSHQRKHS